MDFTSFTELVRLEVSKKISDGCIVQLNDVRKNNGVILKGLTITQGNCNISPTIYLNNYYTDYISGKSTLSHIINCVLDTYSRNKIEQCVDMRFFLNYGDIKERVIYKLINTERNKELLDDIPHIEFLDLSIVFQCLVSQEEFGLSSILIHNAHLKLWDVTTEELYQAAIDNTPGLLKYEIEGMAEVLCSIMQEEAPNQFNSDECMMNFSNNITMHVLSNQHKVEGAACILYPHVLSDFADTIDSNLYIIPSSTHEVLLLPAENDTEYTEIKSMIKEINDTQVSAEEILSYSLYYFDKKTGKISML